MGGAEQPLLSSIFRFANSAWLLLRFFSSVVSVLMMDGLLSDMFLLRQGFEEELYHTIQHHK